VDKVSKFVTIGICDLQVMLSKVLFSAKEDGSELRSQLERLYMLSPPLKTQGE